MCKQTCQEMAGDHQVSRKCKKKSPGIEVILLMFTCNYRKKCLPLPPPPPPNRVCFRKLLLLPPPPNLVGYRRSRKIYRVASAGCPPPNKNHAYEDIETTSGVSRLRPGFNDTQNSILIVEFVSKHSLKCVDILIFALKQSCV